MIRCPITYEPCLEGRFLLRGVKRFSRRLNDIHDFPYSAKEQRVEAALRADKISVQGVQPKLSVRVNIRDSVFELTDRGGRYLVKPQHEIFPELPENEDLCMHLAELVGITVPLHALIYCKDGTLSYVIKRFDRVGRKDKLALEDFAQLTGMDRETKYKLSMEKVIPVFDLCTFPLLEKSRFFRRCIFNYLIGNEDMHLKNFSLITGEGKTEMAPAYDFLSSTIAYLALGKQLHQIEEIALPLKGKKRNLTREIWIDYFARERLGLNPKVISEELDRFSGSFDKWHELINISFLSPSSRKLLKDLVNLRSGILSI